MSVQKKARRANEAGLLVAILVLSNTYVNQEGTLHDQNNYLCDTCHFGCGRPNLLPATQRLTIKRDIYFAGSRFHLSCPKYSSQVNLPSLFLSYLGKFSAT